MRSLTARHQCVTWCPMLSSALAYYQWISTSCGTHTVCRSHKRLRPQSQATGCSAPRRTLSAKMSSS
ncbi:hypothetical protein PF005_g9975 [Phytophthora fragariae]|uniref:Uncharacterized protein n=2 Tax=Phytophthora TaxID=4783 RepID=A0A6A3U3I9_9STRA|nr:hypothetical protein PF003_g443 [Phytophthora fragariae]KAE8987387.1 hypothetical protein PR002_g22067 [Phytophthora rubi]KAE8939206.1 hypothetical protein PF009_g10946 [Phytophthora fragariae]KAE8978947.1 hypothetical protein PF011_g23043 [Phytophthora fragariae]KAE8990150.1 hypothetical protein PR001_g21579 [Phytophthora rubi]